jgi:hypothetical protein
MQHTLLTIALAATLGACAATNGDEGILITKNIAPGDGCTFTSDETEQFISHGMITVLSPQGYMINPQMVSRITALDDQIEQRTVIVQGARIDIAFADTTLFSTTELAELKATGVTHFESAFSAPLRPNGGVTDAGFDLFGRDLIDAVVAKAGLPTSNIPFRTELIATLTVFGDLAGDEVTSQEFKYPVTLCDHCIINDLGACSSVPTTATVRQGHPCGRFQDETVDCCETPDGLLCPAVGTMVPAP